MTKKNRYAVPILSSSKLYWAIVAAFLAALFALSFFHCAHKSIAPPAIEQPTVKYNSSKLNSGWGIIELVLPEEIPPDTFWTPLSVVTIEYQVSEDIGLIVDNDDKGNDYGLFVDLNRPHIYAAIKIDADHNIFHWIYKNGVPVKCNPPEFFKHLGIEPADSYNHSSFKREV